MKVLHIFNELKPSGGEAMMLSAAPLWLPVTEMHILSTGESVGVYADKLSSAGYVIQHIPFRKRLSYFIDLTKLLRRENFDIVHIHTQRANLWLALTSRIALGNKVKLIQTVHHIFKFDGWLKTRTKIERFIVSKVLKATLI